MGHLLSIGPGWLHKLSPHMQEWARWVLDVTADDSGAIPAVARRAVKHWGRAVIGKTAAKGWRTIPLESLGGTGWDYRPAWNAELGAPSHLTDICGVASETVSAGDGDNAYPAILAWVESWVRVYLSRAIDEVGRDNVITCDTDGLIVRSAGLAEASDLIRQFGPLELRLKGSYKQVRVLGPQHVITPTDTKLAGIPRTAEADADGRLSALLWPKLATQMSLRPGNETPGYLRPRQTYTLAASYITGWVSVTGKVHPLTARICPSGQVHLIDDTTHAAGMFPPELQASHVAQMVTPLPKEGQPCTYHTSKSRGSTGELSRSAPMLSSTSCRPRTSRGAARRRSWRTTGGRYAGRIFRAFSGKTRT